MPTDQNLFGEDNRGLYGQDTVVLPDGDKLPQQLVAGISTADFWFGVLGLGSQPSSFSVESRNMSSFLTSMKNKKLAPSLSYGYTAGAAYGRLNLTSRIPHRC
jgi:hypothetical protein